MYINWGKGLLADSDGWTMHMYKSQRANGEFRRLTENAFSKESTMVHPVKLVGGRSVGHASLEVADIDGDEDADILVANQHIYDDSSNAMYINQGAGALTKVTESAFVTDGGNSRSGPAQAGRLSEAARSFSK
jgi:hypothetical protein